MVLFSPTTQILFLNNITCPYLMLHGENDPIFKSEPHPHFEEAVHHHQMRYGDLTSYHVLPNLDQHLGNFDPCVEEKVSHWLRGIEKHRHAHRAA